MGEGHWWPHFSLGGLPPVEQPLKLLQIERPNIRFSNLFIHNLLMESSLLSKCSG